MHRQKVLRAVRYQWCAESQENASAQAARPATQRMTQRVSNGHENNHSHLGDVRHVEGVFARTLLHQTRTFRPTGRPVEEGYRLDEFITIRARVTTKCITPVVDLKRHLQCNHKAVNLFQPFEQLIRQCRANQRPNNFRSQSRPIS